MLNRKIIATLFCALFLVAACATTPTSASDVPQQTGNSFDFSSLPTPKVKSLQKQQPSNLLFVGNSYLYYGDSVHNHVKRMVVAAKLNKASDLTYKSATIGGAAIFDHNIDYLLNPKNLRVDRPFDAVILQGGSADPLSAKRRKRFKKTVAEFSNKIEKSGGETILYMTPAYVPPHKKFRPGMIDDIASLYIQTGNDVNALVIPVGLAFENSYARRPNMSLHKSFDGSHPNLQGTYLAAATVFASLYEVSPVGLPYDYFGEIDPDTALYLQTVAHETVAAFYGRN